MKKYVSRIISSALALVMMITPAFAIVAPEDAVSTELTVEEIKEQLRVINMKKRHLDLAEETEAELNAQESILLEQLENLGTARMDYAQFSEYVGKDFEIAPNFSGMGSSDYNFYVSSPTAITYQGRSLYYVVVDVVPISDDARMWVHSYSGQREAAGTSYYSFKNKIISTSPSSQTTTVDDVFGYVSDNDFLTDYYLTYDAYTISRYIFLGYNNSNDYYDYSLAHVASSVCIDEVHELDNGDRIDWYSRSADSSYFEESEALDYFLPRFFNGNQYDMFYAYTFSYYYGSTVLGNCSLASPYSDPYMY